MKAKKILALVLALVIVLALAACGGKDTGKDNGNKNTGDVKSINVCLASEPDTIDPALNSAVDGATMLAHLFSGLAKWSQDDSGKLVIVPDAAEELPEGVVNADGTVTYTYKLRDGLKWSDGKDVTAGDFVFAWQRAASTALAADYGYMFEIVDGYAEMWETDDNDNYVNPDAKLNAKAIDDKTIEITIENAVNYWNELLAFPVYFPVREDVVANESWATDPSTYVCNGLYTMKAWNHNSLITLEKNANHPDADEVTMDTINFYLSD
ncbi:MAG: peptide ABC transporter substrate-binding protein, partial [Clostridia bacterium]|nr:peptide ABC transporter substrate-binding protein [Clostridia bacterium]